MSLRECMEKTTHREYMAWQEWLDRQWNHPSLTDHYLMQISQRVLQSAYIKQGINMKQLDRAITSKQQKLNFTFDTATTIAERPQMTKDQRMKISKAGWLHAVGYEQYHKAEKPNS